MQVYKARIINEFTWPQMPHSLHDFCYTKRVKIFHWTKSCVFITEFFKTIVIFFHKNYSNLFRFLYMSSCFAHHFSKLEEFLDFSYAFETNAFSKGMNGGLCIMTIVYHIRFRSERRWANWWKIHMWCIHFWSLRL